MDGFKVGLIRKFVSLILPNVRRFVLEGTPLIKPAPDSLDGKTVPEVVALYGHPGVQILKIFLAFPYFVKTAYYAPKSKRSVRENPVTPGETADGEFFQELEKYAKTLGVSAVGYTEVPREYIFRNRVILLKNAIVLIMDMKKRRMEKAPGIKAGEEVWRTYAELSKAVYLLSEFMRKRGYAAQPDPPIGGSTNFPLLAQKAGLGWIGKHGLLISERNGPSQRIAAIYTNIENLPFTDHRTGLYAWIPEFCAICGRCVRECPAGAIYPEPVMLGNGHRQEIDYKKCVVVFSKTLGCGVCIKECAFFRGDFSRIRKAFWQRKRSREGQRVS